MRRTVLVNPAEIININDRAASSQALIGAKAYNLARLMPVLPHSILPCFAVNSTFLAKIFVGYGQEPFTQLEAEKRHHAISTQVAPWLDETKLYAVRSSSIVEDGQSHSFAGLFDTYLGVAVTDVAQRVHDCAASAYRKMREHNLSDRRFSVLLQEMVPASTAGVAFSKNPVTRANEIVIDSVYGLADHMVNGQESGDTFYISKDGSKATMRLKRTMRILERSGIRSIDLPKAMWAAPTLSEADIARISSTVEMIAAHLGTAVDVEWAISETRLFVLQARPITQPLVCRT